MLFFLIMSCKKRHRLFSSCVINFSSLKKDITSKEREVCWQQIAIDARASGKTSYLHKLIKKKFHDLNSRMIFSWFSFRPRKIDKKTFMKIFRKSFIFCFRASLSENNDSRARVDNSLWDALHNASNVDLAPCTHDSLLSSFCLLSFFLVFVMWKCCQLWRVFGETKGKAAFSCMFV